MGKKSRVVQLSTSTVYRIYGVRQDMPNLALMAHFVTEEQTPEGRKIAFDVGGSSRYSGAFNALEHQLSINGKIIIYNPKSETVH